MGIIDFLIFSGFYFLLSRSIKTALRLTDAFRLKKWLSILFPALVAVYVVHSIVEIIGLLGCIGCSVPWYAVPFYLGLCYVVPVTVSLTLLLVFHRMTLRNPS